MLKTGSQVRFFEEDLPAALLLIVFAAIAVTVPAQADTFYHLRSGEQMWASGSLITTEPFSWTQHGRPIANHWWLSQLLFFSAYSTGGQVLVTMLAGLAAFAGTLLSWRLARGSRAVLVAVLIGMVLTLPEWSVRPQVFSLLFTAAALWLLLARRYALLLALLVLWANMHAVVVLGIAIATVPLIDAIVWNRKQLRPALALAMGAVLTPLLTPYGFDYWPSMLATVQTSRDLGLQEYRSAFNLEPANLAFWAIAIALVVLTLRKRRDLARDYDARALTLAALLLLPTAVMSSRNQPFFMLAALPALSRLLMSAETIPSTRPAGRAAWGLTAGAVVMASLLVVVKWKDDGRALGWMPLTQDAISAIEACPGPIYNSFDEGGYLIWFTRQHRVFVDGRVEAYPSNFLHRARSADEGRYQTLFAEYGVRCAVVRTQALYDSLERDASMRLVFHRDGWAVFAR